MSYERECAFNVPEGYGFESSRLCQKDKEWTLYLNDYYWVLDIDDHLEFYYNPEHCIGKIARSDIPGIVMERIRNSCVIWDNDFNRILPGGEKLAGKEEGKPLSFFIDFEKLEDNLTVGNWFYAQGYNYVTTKKKFYRICFPYESHGTEYHLADAPVWDMIRMTASTKTHHYIKTIWELGCFRNVDCSRIVVKPLQEHHWNSVMWSSDFRHYSEGLISSAERSVIKFMRQEVFRHTAYLVRIGWYVSEKERKIYFPNPEMMMRETELYEKDFLLSGMKSYGKTDIYVENMDCLLAAKKWKDKGYDVAVLNMANRRNPGGGVYEGAGAQEENIFRRTNLFQSLYQFAPYADQYGVKKRRECYPLDRNYGGVYSPYVTIFRGLEKDGYPLLDDPFEAAFISVAGMNRPALNADGMISDGLVTGVENKIRTILKIAVLHKHDCLILGALGCGAFRNPPRHIARLFHNIIDSEFRNAFRVIVFAIIEDHNSNKEHNQEGNFEPFYKEFHPTAFV